MGDELKLDAKRFLCFDGVDELSPKGQKEVDAVQERFAAELARIAQEAFGPAREYIRNQQQEAAECARRLQAKRRRVGVEAGDKDTNAGIAQAIAWAAAAAVPPAKATGVVDSAKPAEVASALAEPAETQRREQIAASVLKQAKDAGGQGQAD